jgi:hypothetical protein
MSSACADVTSEDVAATADDEVLAQRIPVAQPGTPTPTPTPTTPNPTTPTTPTPATPPVATTPVTTPATPTAPSAPAGSTTLRDPNGLYFANVVASGEGCPSGSWQVSIAPDGQVFTLTFSQYEIAVAKTDARDRKTIDCTINIKMSSPSGISYGVTSLSYQGYAFLQEGVRGTVAAYYSFLGQQIRNVNGSPFIRSTRKDFVGPYDAPFVYEDTLQTSDVVFSECGKERTLNVNTSLQMRNSAPKSSGYLNLSSIDGRTAGKLILKLSTRRCTAR